MDKNNTLNITNTNIILDIIDKYNVIRTNYINDGSNNVYINKQIDKIYVINLETDVIRGKYIITIMKKNNINFEMITVPKLSEETYNIVGNKQITIGELGCYISHLYCLNDCIKNKHENILIFEDDIIFHKNFHELFETIYKKQKYNILMLGAADFNFSKNNFKAVDNINNTYKPDVKGRHLYGTHAIMYSLEGAKYTFEISLKDTTFFDCNFIQFFEKFEDSAFICFPNLVIAELSTTNLKHHFSIINSETREKYYYKSCFNNLFRFEDYNFIYLDFLKNCIINESLTYEDNINNMLTKKYRKNTSLIEKIKKRMVYDFFTVEDLIHISK